MGFRFVLVLEEISQRVFVGGKAIGGRKQCAGGENCQDAKCQRVRGRRVEGIKEEAIFFLKIRDDYGKNSKRNNFVLRQ